MGSRYAEDTSVPIERSRAEIERIITRYGATRFGSMMEPDRATIFFEVKGRQVQLPIPMPSRKDPKFCRDRYGWQRSDGAIQKSLDQEQRRRWRVLVITVKAMLEAVDSGLATFDQAFLAYIVVPGMGKTIGEAVVPKLDSIYNGAMPALLAENK